MTVCSCQSCLPITRRSLLKTLGASLLFTPLMGKVLMAEAATHQAQALVLTCIDFRFVGWEQDFLQQQFKGQYDLVSLAGASLALTGFPHAAEAETFWDQLELSRNLHQIKTVIIVDHQDCGAYANKIDSTLAQDPVREKQVHRQYLQQAGQAIQDRYPDLEIILYFLTLDNQWQREG
ncbi:MAG: carbonic anhydrase [Microcystaceae cyanobacterium]